MDNDKKILTKSEQFLIDVGLFLKPAELPIVGGAPHKLGKVIYTVPTEAMERPKDALTLHINNLIATYGEIEVKAAFDKHFTIAVIENELKTGLF